MASYLIGYAYPTSTVGGKKGCFYVEWDTSIRLFTCETFELALDFARNLGPDFSPCRWSKDHPSQYKYLSAAELALVSPKPALSLPLPATLSRTQLRGDNSSEYQIYLDCANDGKGGDITRGGAPLKSFDEWLSS